MYTRFHVRRYTFLRVIVAAGAISAFGQAPPRDDLKVTILDGDRAMNSIRLRTAREPIVQIEDENGNRVPGAIVVFSLPSRGPGGTFLNGGSTLSVAADPQGRAMAHGLRPNSLAGDFEIRVNASFQGKTGRAVVHQRNFLLRAPGVGVSAKLIGIIAGVGAGAAVGAIAATRGGGNSTRVAVPDPLTPVPAGVTISQGDRTVGPPR